VTGRGPAPSRPDRADLTKGIHMTAASPARPPASSFYRYAALLPDRVAVIEADGARTTYGELHRRANQVSRALRALGVGEAERVAALTGNTVRFFELVFGAGQVGVQLVPVSTHLTVDEIAYILDNSASRFVFAEEQYLARAAEALAAFGRPPDDLIAVDAPPAADSSGRGRPDGSARPDGPARSYGDLVAAQPDTEPAGRVHAQPLLYTSGTSGRPKGVVWPVRAAVAPEEALASTDALMAARGMRHDPTAITLVTGPLYHGAPYSWAVQGLHRGHTVVLPGRWDSEGFLRLVERYRVTTAQLAPIHFHRLLSLPAAVRARYDTSSLRVVSHAGAPTPVEVKRRMIDWWGPVLEEYYACSEGYGTNISSADWLAHPGSVGRADAAGVRMKILDPDGREAPPGTPGTLWVRNPTAVNSSYLGDSDRTAAQRDDDGYYTVGDMAYIDADGWLFIVDRRTDLILSGAVNIYPAEVERALRAHPAVPDVAVIGLPDPEWGQRVHAVVVAAPGREPGPELAEEIRAVAAERLARFKVPRHIEFTDALPYSPTGKLLRRELRDRAGAGGG